jgi:hypothetical protein
MSSVSKLLFQIIIKGFIFMMRAYLWLEQYFISIHIFLYIKKYTKFLLKLNSNYNNKKLFKGFKRLKIEKI